MIVTIAGSGGAAATIVAQNLALLRARAGRRVLLVDSDPQQPACRWARRRYEDGRKPNILAETILGSDLDVRLAPLQRRSHDIVIHTEGDSPASRAALIAARTVVVPLTAGQADIEHQYPLIARLNSARIFNPALRVLFVLIGEGVDPGGAGMAAARAYAAQVMSATLACTVLHAQGAAGPDCVGGQCVCEAPERDARAAAEMKELYREVFVVSTLSIAA